ncbi:MAG: hypothetical protein HKP48_06815 [Winogradskyella sp.]|uniref:hypothetical protein n=1 Tax=Winogradskyella sp. TaxID=1883156 RepID=UPI0017D7A440|nr:hypothetical protein [Winogradskyella sp.]MBT8246097.1 hypothetical protein [Winogradskyella sp.]NNK22999.1 hypothetical protein [Winogradskyella sp.]
MKKDIHIPEVKDVCVAVVKEHSEVHNTQDWYAYLINDKDVDLEMVIIVSNGYNKDKITATFRKRIDVLPKKSFAKIELLQEDLFALNNQFKVSFFEGNTMFDKTYTFRKNTINEKGFQKIPLMGVKGILVK